jgi:hypothetical protein
VRSHHTGVEPEAAVAGSTPGPDEGDRPGRRIGGNIVTTQRSTFAKLQRERAKKAKAAAKREKRQDRGEGDEIMLDEDAVPEAPRMQYNTEDTIQQLDDLHKRFEAGTINYERFEETKLELLSRLSVD